MQSINKIFSTNKDLLKEPEVEDLIEYCRSLEDTIIEASQKSNKEVILYELIKEIYNSCKTVTNSKKAPEEIKNLKTYIDEFSRDHKIYF